MTVQATFAATLVDEWVRCGVADAVLSPGSRSTPLALALADAADAGRLRLHVHLDERSAGFFALGLGLAAGHPAVVLTTSGTAAVELHPAVVEASYACVPLVVCTADRPPELRDVGAPQAIDQNRLFGGAVRWFLDPGVADERAAGTWRSLAARAVSEAAAGPVHLNLPFRDPLVGVAGELPPPRPAAQPWHRVIRPEEAVDPDLLAGAERVVIVAGRGAGVPEAVAELAAANGWPVLADPLSGCRVVASTTIAAFDAMLRHPPFAARQRPDAVLRLGAAPASKALASWLAGLDATQVLVDPARRWADPDRTSAVVVRAEPASVCWALTASAVADRDWTSSWAGAESVAQDAIDEVLAAHPEPTEPGVVRAVAACLPAGARLVVSSSMPVRDLEWYAAPRDGLDVFANRGANGIDGVVSTALGVAATGPPVVALLGDLAFLHDAGGLLGAARRGVDCVFVVIDNRGGGIFSFLPQAAAVDAPRFERLFGTPQAVDVAALVRAHDLEVSEPAKADDVAPAVADAMAAGGVHVVLVRTDRAANVDVHDELHAAVAAAVG